MSRVLVIAPSLVALSLVAVSLGLLGCGQAEERDPSQWPISRVELERAIPTDDPAEGTYRVSCLPCHGVDGRGAGGSTGADLTSAEGPLRKPDAELRASIRDGLRGPIGVMPPHGAILDDAQIDAVLAYVRRRFGPEITPIEAAPGDRAPGEEPP